MDKDIKSNLLIAIAVLAGSLVEFTRGKEVLGYIGFGITGVLLVMVAFGIAKMRK